MATGPSRTPLRLTLLQASSLQADIQDDMGAVIAAHRCHFEERIRSTFADSLDLDAATLHGHEQENRWDYLLGHAPSGEVIGVEPHSAKQDEISTVIAKRAAALVRLRSHLGNGKRVSKWLWVASGKVHFADTEKAKLRLDQNGIEFVGKAVGVRHLPATSASDTPATRKPLRKGKRR
jgi:hypothetical protein